MNLVLLVGLLVLMEWRTIPALTAVEMEEQAVLVVALTEALAEQKEIKAVVEVERAGQALAAI